MIEIRPDSNQEILSVILGLNSPPESVIESVIEIYKKRFHLRDDVCTYYSSKERSEISDFGNLNPEGRIQLIVSETLQDFIENVHRMYETILSGQTEYEKRKKPTGIYGVNGIESWVERRYLEWPAPYPLFSANLITPEHFTRPLMIVGYRKK